LRAGSIAVPGMKRALLEAMCRGLPTGELRDLCGALEAQAAKTLPLKGQLIWGARQDSGNEGFRI